MRDTWEEPEGEEEVPHRMFIKVFSYETKRMWLADLGKTMGIRGSVLTEDYISHP